MNFIETVDNHTSILLRIKYSRNTKESSHSSESTVGLNRGQLPVVVHRTASEQEAQEQDTPSSYNSTTPYYNSTPELLSTTPDYEFSLQLHPATPAVYQKNSISKA
jgi:hypothetical protein